MTNHTVATKLNVSGADGDALERFCKLYNSRAGGKSALLNDLLAGGLILKETGILDLVLNLDEDSSYRELSNKGKTRALIAELAELFGNVEQTIPVNPVDNTGNAPSTIKPPAVELEKKAVKPIKKAALPDLGL